MTALKHLERFFGSSDVSLLTDSKALAAHARGLAINALLIDELNAMPTNSACITLTREGTESLLRLAARNRSGRAIYTQAHAFDPTLDSAIYCLDLICATDYRLAMRNQEQLLTLLDDHHHLVLSGADSHGVLEIAQNVSPYAMIEEDVLAAEEYFIFPLAELLEVHYTHMDPAAPRAFTLNGEFKVAGMLSARGYHDPSIAPSLIRSLKGLAYNVAVHGATLLIEDSQVRAFRVGNLDYRTLLNEATGSRGLALTECAFGVNASIAERIDYRVNSQLNEGIEGLHVAVGDGRCGYHIDLLIPGVSPAPLP
ncbi:hypothetical protein [Pseudomonas sp. NA-150]|uniref:hypothetical protein n=1 Tax=Pseudomonas sp. NA-150 TaxID=3367525 RepID=UPI0037CC9224